MKISSTSTTGAKPIGGTKRASKGSAKGTSSGFSVGDVEKAESASPVATSAPVGPIASVQALLAVQEAESTDPEARSRAFKRGHDLLDMLEGLRRAILLGVISLGDLRRLADMARAQQGSTGDANLDTILAEIELRAEVELAKYEQ